MKPKGFKHQPVVTRCLVIWTHLIPLVGCDEFRGLRISIQFSSVDIPVVKKLLVVLAVRDMIVKSMVAWSLTAHSLLPGASSSQATTEAGDAEDADQRAPDKALDAELLTNKSVVLSAVVAGFCCSSVIHYCCWRLYFVIRLLGSCK